MTLRSVLIATLLASPVLLSACETTQQRVQSKENSLAAAGFVDRPANTPQRQAMLDRLPANKFFRRVRGDTVHYVYADPVNCHCLYVGDQAAYSRYQQQQQAQHLADQNAFAAQEYDDAQWNWGAWGYGGRFGFGPGFGW